MLYITFEEPDNLDRSIDAYFNNRYDPEWFNDDVVKQIVLDIDHTKIESPNLAVSPVLGSIPVTKISGGAKALILALKTDRLIYGAACGNNCSEWLNKIGRLKDVYVYMSYPMQFDRGIHAYCPEYKKIIKNQDDFDDCYLRSRGYD